MMSYLVFCTFDLKNASSQDYKNAYEDLETMGLKRIVIADSGNKVVIPTTSVMGELEGDSATSIRDDIRNRVKSAFKYRNFTSEIFITVGDNWTWGSTTMFIRNATSCFFYIGELT